MVGQTPSPPTHLHPLECTFPVSTYHTSRITYPPLRTNIPHHFLTSDPPKPHHLTSNPHVPCTLPLVIKRPKDIESVMEERLDDVIALR